MKYAGWQRVEKDAPVKPFVVVKAFSSRSHHHTKRATNDDFSLYRLHHHLPHHQRPVLALMRMRAATGASAGAAVETRIDWIPHH